MASFPSLYPTPYTDMTLETDYVGCHNPDSSLNVTFVSEGDRVFAYATNGSLNVTTDTGDSIRAEGGALRVAIDSGSLTLSGGSY